MPVNIYNYAHLEYEQRQETGADANIDSAGFSLGIIHDAQIKVDHALWYSSDAFDGNFGPIFTNWPRGNLSITDTIALVWRNKSSELFMDWFGQQTTDQTPTLNSHTTGGAYWANAFDFQANETVMDKNIWIGWCETANCAVTSSTDGTTVTETEMAADDDAAWTNQTRVGAAGETLSARLAELNLGNDYSNPGDIGLGTEGLELNPFYDAFGVLRPAAGETDVWSVSAPSTTSLKFRTNVPTGSTRTCYVQLMATNFGVEGPEGTASLAVDFTGNTHPTNDTITRNDGGSWITDHYYVGGEIEIWSATTAGNNGRYEIVSRTASVLTIQAIGGGDAGITTSNDDTTAVIQADPEEQSAAGNGVDLAIQFSNLVNDEFYRWRANCTGVPFSWARNHTKINP